MNHEGLKRRIVTNSENDGGLKRRRRRVEVPEDYDDNDFDDGYDISDQEAGHADVSEENGN